MKNFSKDILFLITFSAIIAIGIGITYLNKSKKSEPSTSSSTSVYNYPTVSSKTAAAFNSSDYVNYKNYAMTEPFAANAPTDFTPEAWMQMMYSMMNIMQMTQMMHQMAAMPMQMMNLAWMNPYGLSPTYNASSVQPMDPAEYKKWYEQQQEAMKMDKK